MSSLNKVQIMGRLGGDPMVTTTMAGIRCVRFHVATGGRWKDRRGIEHNDTEWHRVVVFHERTIEIVEKHFRKGSPVFVEGELHTRKWQDESGQSHYRAEIVVPAFQSRGVLFPPIFPQNYMETAVDGVTEEHDPLAEGDGPEKDPEKGPEKELEKEPERQDHRLAHHQGSETQPDEPLEREAPGGKIPGGKIPGSKILGSKTLESKTLGSKALESKAMGSPLETSREGNHTGEDPAESPLFSEEKTAMALDGFDEIPPTLRPYWGEARGEALSERVMEEIPPSAYAQWLDHQALPAGGTRVGTRAADTDLDTGAVTGVGTSPGAGAEDGEEAAYGAPFPLPEESAEGRTPLASFSKTPRSETAKVRLRHLQEKVRQRRVEELSVFRPTTLPKHIGPNPVKHNPSEGITKGRSDYVQEKSHTGHDISLKEQAHVSDQAVRGEIHGIRGCDLLLERDSGTGEAYGKSFFPPQDSHETQIWPEGGIPGGGILGLDPHLVGSGDNTHTLPYPASLPGFPPQGLGPVAKS
ncbi:single-stranded DNA-binding protein [Entomobacter blattae]|uniref:Single-stranded DNA-binding protein n=1 Tax=Entomobacter blattae TaxID=2762277 RepID=A0A7H1NR50_9PROT|nr:single-stranded DNA-binding protein [Entomobacter blattae]QNT78260.1 Single-stranded DNA-binding protein [Entomobacter blattae]